MPGWQWTSVIWWCRLMSDSWRSAVKQSIFRLGPNYVLSKRRYPITQPHGVTSHKNRIFAYLFLGEVVEISRTDPHLSTKNARILLMQCRSTLRYTQRVNWNGGTILKIGTPTAAAGIDYDICADMNIDIKIDVKWNCWEDMDWIYPAQNRDMWRVLVDVEMHCSIFHALNSVMCVKNEQNACNSTGVYFHFDIFTYMFRPLILPSSVWHLC